MTASLDLGVITRFTNRGRRVAILMSRSTAAAPIGVLGRQTEDARRQACVWNFEFGRLKSLLRLAAGRNFEPIVLNNMCILASSKHNLSKPFFSSLSFVGLDCFSTFNDDSFDFFNCSEFLLGIYSSRFFLCVKRFVQPFVQSGTEIIFLWLPKIIALTCVWYLKIQITVQKWWWGLFSKLLWLRRFFGGGFIA